MKKKILFVASESVPFIKTGGLADVVGTLPKSFSKEKFDIRVVLPEYLCIPEKYRSRITHITNFMMEIGDGAKYVGVETLVEDGITFYFIDNEHYFSGSTPYTDMYTDLEKFAYFSKAALSMLPVIDFKPDIIHCHDWQAGLVPVYLNTLFQGNNFYHGIKTIMTVHNLRFQGCCDIEGMMKITGLPKDVFTPDKLEFYEDANMLKGGLVYADRITTVSETYAQEIQTPYYGETLDGLLSARHDSLKGIINGIDYDEYNPDTDELIAKNYNSSNFRMNKLINKLSLQKTLGMPEDKDKFVIGLISRLTDQKGLDLIECVMDDICDSQTQFVALGTGEDRYEHMLSTFEFLKKGQVSASICYSEERSHQIYAGCDAILMPSAFEPCGLCQLMGLRYGSVPIVRETGGLKDTVEPYNEFENTGTGFSFTNYNAHDMLHTINYAKKIYFENRKDWDYIVERGMKKDFSWKHSAKVYEEYYINLIN